MVCMVLYQLILVHSLMCQFITCYCRGIDQYSTHSSQCVTYRLLFWTIMWTIGVFFLSPFFLIIHLSHLHVALYLLWSKDTFSSLLHQSYLDTGSQFVSCILHYEQRSWLAGSLGHDGRICLIHWVILPRHWICLTVHVVL